MSRERHILLTCCLVTAVLVACGCALGIILLGLSYHKDASSRHRTQCHVTRCNITTRYCGVEYSRNTYTVTCIYADIDLYYSRSDNTYTHEGYVRRFKTTDSYALTNPPTCGQLLEYGVNNTIQCWFDERHPHSSLKLYPPRDVGSGQIVGIVFIGLLWAFVILAACVAVVYNCVIDDDAVPRLTPVF